jgi:AraC family transcriptional regulator
MLMDQHVSPSGSGLAAANAGATRHQNAAVPSVSARLHPESSGYGERFGEAFGSEATTFFSHRLGNTDIAVTKIRSDNPQRGLSAPLAREDSFLVGYHLVDDPAHQFFDEGQPAPIVALMSGQTTFYDLKRDPRFNINKTIHAVYFYLPRAVLNALAEMSEATWSGELQYQPGVGVHDPVMRALVGLLLPAFDNPEQASRIFVKHIMMAVGVHVLKTYGGMKPIDVVRGGLAPRQLKRVEDTLAANLAGNISCAALANDCGVSLSHFSRAFRQSKGLSPHRWMLERRVDRAKSILRDPSRSLSDVALSCGFADQSHFTRVFTGQVGISPGAWRRNLQ